MAERNNQNVFIVKINDEDDYRHEPTNNNQFALGEDIFNQVVHANEIEEQQVDKDSSGGSLRVIRQVSRVLIFVHDYQCHDDIAKIVCRSDYALCIPDVHFVETQDSGICIPVVNFLGIQRAARELFSLEYLKFYSNKYGITSLLESLLDRCDRPHTLSDPFYKGEDNSLNKNTVYKVLRILYKDPDKIYIPEPFADRSLQLKHELRNLIAILLSEWKFSDYAPLDDVNTLTPDLAERAVGPNIVETLDQCKLKFDYTLRYRANERRKEFELRTKLIAKDD